MQLILYSWNSNAINDGTNYRAWYEIGQRSNLSATPQYTQVVQAFPVLSAVLFDQHTFTIKVQCLGTYHEQREQLNSWFQPDGKIHALVAKDIANSDTQWQLNATFNHMVEETPAVFAVTFALSDPIWRQVTDSSDTWNVTASGQTEALTIVGSCVTKPVFEITPTASRTGQFAYKRFVTVYNPIDISYPESVGWVEITGGGLNTAALVSGGKMLASCDDLRVVADGREVDRWIANPNASNTKVYINHPMGARVETTLKTSIAGSGAVSTIALNIPSGSSGSWSWGGAVRGSAAHLVLIGSEIFHYTGYDSATSSLTGCVRALKGTSMASHTAGVTVRFLPSEIWMLYGNSGAPTPVTDDTRKPIIDLANTTATSVQFSNFQDSASVRPGEWSGAVLATLGGESLVYTGDYSGGSLSADPSTELGLSMQAYQSANVWKAETAKLVWSFYHPAGITQVIYSGKKYRVGAGWPVVGLQKSLDGVTWAGASTQVSPGTPSSWTAFGPVTASLSGSYRNIRFVIGGSLPATASAEADAQFDTLTLSLSSSNVPVVSLGAEQNNYHVNTTLTNTNTGESLTITAPCAIGSTITVDCVNKKAYRDDGAKIPVVLNTQRADWLDLSLGTVTLQCDDAGITGQTIVTTWSEAAFL